MEEVGSGVAWTTPMLWLLPAQGPTNTRAWWQMQQGREADMQDFLAPADSVSESAPRHWGDRDREGFAREDSWLPAKARDPKRSEVRDGWEMLWAQKD